MTCAACSNRIEKVLNKMDEVDATVNLTTEKASIQYDKDKVDPEDITKKINDLGYGVRYEQTELDITGMTCAACSSRIEKVLNKTSGVEYATVNLTTENAMIEYNPNMIDEKGLIDKIGNLGYGANKKRSNEEKISHKDQELKTMKWKVIIAAILSAPLLVTMLIIYWC